MLESREGNMLRWPWSRGRVGAEIPPSHPNFMMAHETPGGEPKAIRPEGSEYYVAKSFVSDEVLRAPRPLGMDSLRRCTLVSDRVELLNYLPKKGRVAELGVYHGSFAKQILETCAPIELSLFDLTFAPLDALYFAPYV